MVRMTRFAGVQVGFALGLLGAVLMGPGRAEAQGREWKQAVYTQTNDASGNAVVAFNRAPDGTLTQAGTYSTGGRGTGTGLGSQGAVTLSKNGRFVFAVNAGSDQVSVFAVTRDGLQLLDTVASGGDQPISVTSHERVVYVLNGGSSTIAGFNFTRGDRLTPIDQGQRTLSGSAVNAAQIQFSPNGNVVAVTERATNTISTFTIARDGRAQGPVVQASSGQTPFGFDFTPSGTLVVSEAFGGAPNGSAASSYRVGADGRLGVISGSVPTTETAACWLVITPNGHYAYVANAGSGTISGYRIATNGGLVLRDADGVTATTGAGTAPVDEALSKDGRVLYVLLANTDQISAFAVQEDGALRALGVVGGLPAGTTGLAAR